MSATRDEVLRAATAEEAFRMGYAQAWEVANNAIHTAILTEIDKTFGLALGRVAACERVGDYVREALKAAKP